MIEIKTKWLLAMVFVFETLIRIQIANNPSGVEAAGIGHTAGRLTLHDAASKR